MNRLKRNKVAPLDPSINEALRELAGWPVQSHGVSGARHRHREVTVHRDGEGRVISSLEHFEEDEYEEYSDNWGK